MANAINEITAGALTQDIGTGTTVQILYRISITPADTIGGGVQVNPSHSSDVQRFRNSFIGNLAPFANSTGWINQFTLGDFVLVQSRNSANQVLRTDVGRVVARSTEGATFGNIDIDFELAGTGSYTPPLGTHRGNYSIIRGDDVVGGVTSTEDFRIEAGLILPGLPSAGTLGTDANGRVTVNPPPNVGDIAVTTDVGDAVADRGFPSAPERGDWHTLVSGTASGPTFASILDLNGNTYHFGVNNAGGRFAVVANILLREIRVSNTDFFGKQNVIPSLDFNASLPTLAWRPNGSTNNNAFDAATDPDGWIELTAVLPENTYSNNIRVAAPTGAGQTFDNTYGVIPIDAEIGYVTGVSPDTSSAGLYLFDGSEWEEFTIPADAFTQSTIGVFNGASEITPELSVLRFEGDGINIVENDPPLSGDLTITLTSEGDNFSYELQSSPNLNISTFTGVVSFLNIPDGHDYIVGSTGYAKSRDLGDEFTFEVTAVDRDANFLSVQIIETLRVSGSAKGFWQINQGPPAERYAITGTSDVGSDERSVTFARSSAGLLHGKVNVAGLGSSGTGTGGGLEWVYSSLGAGGAREDDTFIQSQWEAGDTRTLNLHGLDNPGWENGQTGNLIAGNASGSVRNVIVNFRVTGMDYVSDPNTLTIVVTSSILHTHGGNFFWSIYPGLADVPVDSDAYTDLNTSLYNTGPTVANGNNTQNAADEDVSRLLGRDTENAPTLPGDIVHFDNVNPDLSWVIGQSGYTTHSSGNAAFTFIVRDVTNAALTPVGATAFNPLAPNRMAIEIVDVLYNTLGTVGNNGANNVWAIFAGAPTPEVEIPPSSGALEVRGDVDNDMDAMGNPVLGVGVATSNASRIIFNEDDFELHIGGTTIPGTPDTPPTYTAITQGGTQLATDIYEGTVNSAFFTPFLNVQIGLFDSTGTVGGTENVATARRDMTTPIIDNNSGTVIAIQTNFPGEPLGGANATYREILIVRNDTDSNGNRSRIRCDFADPINFTRQDFLDLGTNVPLFFRSADGITGTPGTTNDPNQVTVRAKAQVAGPQILTSVLDARDLADTTQNRAVISTTSNGNMLYTITHNLDTLYPIVQVYEETLDSSNPPNIQSRNMVLPMETIVTGLNTLTITFPVAVVGTAVIMG